MRTNISIETNFLSALIVLLCAACLQAQTGDIGHFDVPTANSNEVRVSRYQFVESARSSTSQSEPIQAPIVVAEAPPLVTEQPSTNENNRFSGPLDAKYELPVPRTDIPTLPLQPRVEQSEFQYQSQMPVNVIPFAEQISSTRPRQASAQEPVDPKVAKQVLVNRGSQEDANPVLVTPQMTYVPASRKAYYFPICEDDVCDEWDGFIACGGLKAYPGHWGLRCLTGCDPCEVKPCDCHACKSKHGFARSKKACAHCDPCDSSAKKCDRCRRRNDASLDSRAGSSTRNKTENQNECGCASCAKKPGNLMEQFEQLFR